MRRFGFKKRYRAEGVRFDGTNDYLRLTSGLIGAADSKLLTVSFWIRKQGADSVSEIFMLSTTDSSGGAGTTRMAFTKSNANRVTFGAYDSGGTLDLVARSTDGSVSVASGWVHALLSVDMSDTAKRHLYVNDASDLTVDVYTNATLKFTAPVWNIGADPLGATKLNADVADLWFKPGVYVDLSIAANRRKFIDSSKKPVDLGADGTAPGLGTPIVYLSKRPGESANQFAVNRGTGGNFTVTGALADAATSPSD